MNSRNPNFSPCIYMARTLAPSQFSQSFFLSFETLSYPRLNLIHCVPEDDLELVILLPSSPECRDYKHAPRSLDYMLLRIKLGSSCLLNKQSTNRATPVAPRFIIFMCIYKHLLNYEYFCKKLKPSRPVRRTCFPMMYSCLKE